MTDADLAQFVTNLCAFLTRDLTDLAVFGINSMGIAALQALQNDFEVYPSDVQLNNIVAQKTDAKDAQRRLIEDLISYFRVRASVVFGETTGFYKEFGFIYLAQSSDTSFLSMARMIAATAEKYLTELSAKGQTQGEIDNLISACNTFENLLRDKASAESDRTESARIRVNKGNEMYVVASDYCELAQTYYANRNPAKYQDYIIYGSGEAVGVHGAPYGLHFSDSTTLAWTEIDNATSYGVSVSSDGGTNWQADIFTSTNSTQVPTISTGKLFYKVRGHNSTGYGEYSASFEYLFGLDAVENFTENDGEFTWNQVQYANGYDIERAAAGTGSYTLIYNSGDTHFFDSPGSGNWNYRIRASYGITKSEWTYLDVIV
jgi:hypothetical protein